MDEKRELYIHFRNLDNRKSNVQAIGFYNLLKNTSDEISVDPIKEDPKSQDLGSTLLIILSAPAIIVLAKGICDYINRKPNIVFEILNKNKDQETKISIDASDLRNKDLEYLIRLIDDLTK